MTLLALLAAAGCDRDKPTASGLVPDSAAPVVAVEAGPVDTSQCAGCQLTQQVAWTFEGIYRDDACTEPLAQLAAPPCAAIPATGPASLTYVDEVGGRKAGETANVTLGEQVSAAVPRFRRNAKGCVKANEAAIDVTPPNCAGQKVCRDATGTLACTGCRTFANGCPDFEESRMYALIVDPAIKGGGGGGGGGGNVARLKQCCAALAAEGKRLGSSPEAGVLVQAAAQCMTIANGVAPNGTAPELGAIRTLLAGRNVPPVCAGF
jgi:ribosomal protein L37AE/L43A